VLICNHCGTQLKKKYKEISDGKYSLYFCNDACAEKYETGLRRDDIAKVKRPPNGRV
jgi:hypothetical protein